MNKTYAQSRIFFLILFGLIGYLSFLVLRPFLGVILLSLITVVVFYPLYKFYLAKMYRSKLAATASTMLSIFAIIIIPLSLLVNIVYNQALIFNEDVQSLLSSDDFSYDELLVDLNDTLDKLPGNYELTETEVKEGIQDVVQPVGEYIVNKVISISSSSFSLFASIIVYLTLVATFLPNFTNFTKFVRILSPLPNELDDLYLKRVKAMTVSMVLGTFIVALVQGLASSVFFYIAGVSYIAFWSLLVIFFSIIPVGSGIITFPIGIFLIATGNVPAGVFLIVTNILIVNNIDNYLRPQLVSKDAQLPAVLVLLGVLGGIQAFGFLGVVYGPVIMIMFITSLEIYLKHYKKHL